MSHLLACELPKLYLLLTSLKCLLMWPVDCKPRFNPPTLLWSWPGPQTVLTPELSCSPQYPLESF